jgi:hypothetical protein
VTFNYIIDLILVITLGVILYNIFNLPLFIWVKIISCKVCESLQEHNFIYPNSCHVLVIYLYFHSLTIYIYACLYMIIYVFIHVSIYSLIGIASTYEGKHETFDLFSLAYMLLNMTFSSSINLIANNIISFFFMAEQNSIVYVYHIFLIHSSVIRASGLLPKLGYFKLCFNKHGCVCDSIISLSTFLWMYVQEWYHWTTW